jgi:hypothetical protein
VVNAINRNIPRSVAIKIQTIQTINLKIKKDVTMNGISAQIGSGTRSI